MKRIVCISLLIMQLFVVSVLADSDSPNESDNDSNVTMVGPFVVPELPEINTTDMGNRFSNATKTGVDSIDQFTSWLGAASPFLLLIVGVIFLLLSGVGRYIGIIFIILALIRFIQVMFF